MSSNSVFPSGFKDYCGDYLGKSFVGIKRALSQYRRQVVWPAVVEGAWFWGDFSKCQPSKNHGQNKPKKGQISNFPGLANKMRSYSSFRNNQPDLGLFSKGSVLGPLVSETVDQIWTCLGRGSS